MPSFVKLRSNRFSVILVKMTMMESLSFQYSSTISSKPDVLVQFQQVKLSGCNAELKYLVVLPLGGEDLPDEISHGNFVGVDPQMALDVAIGIAQALEWLNEVNGVMHGDIKQRCPIQPRPACPFY